MLNKRILPLAVAAFIAAALSTNSHAVTTVVAKWLYPLGVVASEEMESVSFEFTTSWKEGDTSDPFDGLVSALSLHLVYETFGPYTVQSLSKRNNIWVTGSSFSTPYRFISLTKLAPDWFVLGFDSVPHVSHSSAGSEFYELRGIEYEVLEEDKSGGYNYHAVPDAVAAVPFLFGILSIFGVLKHRSTLPRRAGVQDL